jgi:hypothetical protein
MVLRQHVTFFFKYTHLFSQLLLNTYHMPNIVLGPKNIAMSRTEKNQCLLGAFILVQQGEEIC